MTTKTIRGLREEDWAEIKAMASERGVPISKIIVNGAKELKKKSARDAWESILSWKPDPSVAAEIEKGVKEFRKDFELREFGVSHRHKRSYRA